ncbi:MAG: methylmalonyl-CoA mutase family protein, partial [Actinomycetes bacterium]
MASELEPHETLSGLALQGSYGDEQWGSAGEYPYRRGLHASMYRGKLWTMRMFAGFGTPKDTNAR